VISARIGAEMISLRKLNQFGMAHLPGEPPSVLRWNDGIGIASKDQTAAIVAG
jgi:hypothetical protein